VLVTLLLASSVIFVVMWPLTSGTVFAVICKPLRQTEDPCKPYASCVHCCVLACWADVISSLAHHPLAGMRRERVPLKASTEVMTPGPPRTSDGNIGNNAGGSGSIGTATMLPLGLPPRFRPLPLGHPRRPRLTCDGKTSYTCVGKAWHESVMPCLTMMRGLLWGHGTRVLQRFRFRRRFFLLVYPSTPSVHHGGKVCCYQLKLRDGPGQCCDCLLVLGTAPNCFSMMARMPPHRIHFPYIDMSPSDADVLHRVLLSAGHSLASVPAHRQQVVSVADDTRSPCASA